MGKGKYKARVSADPDVVTCGTVKRSVVKAAIEVGITKMLASPYTTGKYNELIDELRTVGNSTEKISWSAYWTLDRSEFGDVDAVSEAEMREARKNACGCALMQCGIKVLKEDDIPLPLVPTHEGFVSGFDTYMREHAGDGCLATVVED